jgi:hypothetical protein
MNPVVVPAVRAQLVDTVEVLVRELADYPAGSVLRCFSRAVAAARLAGTPDRALAEVAARTTRHMLARRSVGPEPCPS